MGVVPQLDNLDVDVTVEDNLAVFARLYRVQDVGAAVDRALDLARLRDRRHDAVDELSGGMRRRLLLARGLVHDPKLILLDEPTVGLDPQIRTELWTLIDDLRSRGKTILMSTHYIEEAERLADEVAVMDGGQDHRPRPHPAKLIAEHAGTHTAEVYGPPERLAEVRADAEGSGLAVRPAGPAVAIVGSERADNGAIPEDAVVRAATLEDVFVLLTGEEAEIDGERDEPTQADAAPRTGGDRRRDEPRARQLPHLLEGDDLLQRARTDRLPARLRPRLSARPWSTKSTASPTSSSSAPAWWRPR